MVLAMPVVIFIMQKKKKNPHSGFLSTPLCRRSKINCVDNDPAAWQFTFIDETTEICCQWNDRDDKSPRVSGLRELVKNGREVLTSQLCQVLCGDLYFQNSESSALE